MTYGTNILLSISRIKLSVYIYLVQIVFIYDINVGMFYRQCMLVIDGKYSSDDGLSTAAMISNTAIIGEEQQP
jgi:hypothetical protein